MLRKQIGLLFASGFIFALAHPAFAQEASPPKGKEARWEGRIETSDKDKSMLTVRQIGGNMQRNVVYDSSTKWVSQYHGDRRRLRDLQGHNGQGGETPRDPDLQKALPLAVDDI